MTEEEKTPDVAPPMPGWVPLLIGVVLVLIAALAVWTGIRYRHPTLANGIVKSRRPPRPMTGAGPPGGGKNAALRSGWACESAGATGV